MDGKTMILVVIPMFGKEEYTRKCIELTLKNSGMPVDILVVDDGSPEPFFCLEEHTERNVSVLRLPENTGFTNAVNQGILWAQKKDYAYVHLLNNDTEPQPNFIKILWDFMESNEVVGIAGSARILETDSPHNIELMGADLIRGYQRCTDGNIPQDPIFCHWVPLCSTLIRMDMIREIGLLDKRMKIWCSDNDYCIRANFAGWNVAVLPKSLVKHKHAVTTDTIQKERKYSPEDDQRILIEKMAGMQYAKLMQELPLDASQGTFGKILFEVYQK